MLEGFSIGWIPSFLYNLIKDIAGINKKLTPRERVELREKWKPVIEEIIRHNFRNKLRQDVIIRDVRRVNQYPDIDDTKRGISPWFRMGLVATYHRGFMVAGMLAITELIEIGDNEFREFDHDIDNRNEPTGTLKVYQLGLIPFENIVSVDRDGDEYYPYPHIYCNFSIKKMPYERIAYFTEGQLFPDSLPYYEEVADFDSVRKNTQRFKRHHKKNLLTHFGVGFCPVQSLDLL